MLERFYAALPYGLDGIAHRVAATCVLLEYVIIRGAGGPKGSRM